ncbi:hypothetical protein DMJ13_14300 [halophilic archaeon]|nr:hypothetical protein DMJ13_14300 [halophilic archaeon]
MAVRSRRRPLSASAGHLGDHRRRLRENVEPRDWYLRLRRATGVLVMVAGFVLSGGVRYL